MASSAPQKTVQCRRTTKRAKEAATGILNAAFRCAGHEAETAILFCGTREKVRHMHATLQERGFAVVSLSGENSQSETRWSSKES